MPTGIEHVIIIGVDGLSPDGIHHARTPNMNQQIAKGAVKWNARTVLPTSSSPNWASMIMGAGPEQHGITDNDWERDDHSLPPVVMGDEGIFPTIFGVIRQQKPEAEIGAVYHWEGFGRLFEKNAVNYDRHFSTEDSTARDFADYLTRKKPLFSFVHFDHVDHAGHHDGHGSTQYYDAVSKADSLVGEILGAIKAAGIEQSSLVIITADHGGKGYGHGGPSIAEGEITMILSGKDIKNGYKIQQQVYTYDLAATIAFALNIVPPYAWIGRPIKSAFEGFSEPVNLWLGKTIIPSPLILPAAHLYQQAGGLYIDTPALVTIKPVAQETVTRFTINGKEPDSLSEQYDKPFTLDSTTVVMARSFDKQGNGSLTATAYFRKVQSGAGNGLKAFFYPGNNWKNLPVFSNLKSGHEWISPEINFSREQVLPWIREKNDVFGVVLKGYLQIDQPGNYTFALRSDDGSKLFINDKEVVDNDGSHGLLEKSGSIKLEKGRLPIRVEYFNASGGFWLDAFYKGPGMVRQLIPANKLFLSQL